MEWMINRCWLNDATWQSIMHCSSCHPCWLLTSPAFFFMSGYFIVATATKWDVAASKYVDDYDHVMAKVGQENNLWPSVLIWTDFIVGNQLDVVSLCILCFFLMMLMYQHVVDLRILYASIWSISCHNIHIYIYIYMNIYVNIYMYIYIHIHIYIIYIIYIYKYMYIEVYVYKGIYIYYI